MINWINKNGANPGRSSHKLSMEAAEMIYNTRTAISEFFGMEKPENTVLVPGATFGMNLLLFGLLSPGEHVITTDLEHNSVLRPLWHLRKKGVEVTVVPVDFFDTEKFVDRLMQSIKSNTKAIVCTQCSNVCGFLLPVEEIALRKPSFVHLIVDGAQGAGMIETNVKQMGIDYYCVPSHKGLLGPQGGGVVIINNKPPAPLVFGGTGTESLSYDQPLYLPERLESGTLSAPICAGMLAGVNFLKKIGVDKVKKHKEQLTAYSYDRLSSVKGIELYMEPVKEKCFSVIPFNIRNRTSDEVAEMLNENDIFVRSGLHCAPLFHKRMKTDRRGMVRMSLGWFNDYRDIDFVAKNLEKLK